MGVLACLRLENKKVGLLIIGIAILMTVIVILFHFALKDIVSANCDHGPTCTMYKSIEVQTWISGILIAIVFIIGVVLFFSKPKERIIIKTKKEKKKVIDKSKLDKNEKQVIDILQQENGAIFQGTLMEKLNIGKVGITRLLDKLEAKQLIERKRRGMNNIVVLKD